MIHSTIRKSFAAIAASFAATAFAGDLNPPAGAIGPTMKPLSQIEPRIAISAATTPGDADSVFRIASPGSYYLTGEVLIPPGKRGIEISADDVTLDLNGFRIGGFAGTLEGIAVISESFNRKNIVVSNGVIRNVQGDGVRLLPAFIYDATSCRVESMTISDCGGYGIRTGTSAIIRNCTVANSAFDNYYARSNTVIDSCTSLDAGFTGIQTSGATVITRCNVSGSGQAGIETSNYCTISDCVSTFNDQEGIIGHDGTVIQGCTASHNERHGIVNYGRGGMIVHCTADSNTQDGIRVVGRTLVKNNACNENGYVGGVGANISVDGNSNRIEGNHCAKADVGIEVIYDANVIVGNSCTENGVNWSIAANNVHGPIIDRRNPASPAVNGNTAAGTMGTTDPHANFTY